MSRDSSTRGAAGTPFARLEFVLLGARPIGLLLALLTLEKASQHGHELRATAIGLAVLFAGQAAIHARQDRLSRRLTGSPWTDLTACVLATSLIGATLPPGAALTPGHDLLWPIWLTAAGVWTLHRGPRAGWLIVALSVLAHETTAALSGSPAMVAEPLTLLSRAGRVSVGVLLGLAFRPLSVGRGSVTSPEESGATEQRERMHDLLHGDALGALGVISDLARVGLERSADERRLRDIHRIAFATERSVRRELDAIGRSHARFAIELEQLVWDLQHRHPELLIRIVWTTDRTLDASGVTALLSAVREALINVTRHAQASRAWVVVGCRTGETATVIVRDDGIGSELDQASRRGTVERIERPLTAAGGRARWSNTTAGLRWEFELPLRGADDGTSPGTLRCDPS